MVSSKNVRVGLYNRLNVASVTSLLANGSASLYHAVAPPGSAFPYIVFSKISSVSRKAMGTNAFDSQLWMVKAVSWGEDRPNASPAEDIAKAISDRLDFATLTITGGTNLYLARESDLDFAEVDDDQVYSHHGSRYRVIVEAT